MANDNPSQFGNSDMYGNPNVTLPLPSPQNIPRPAWTQPRMRMPWTLSTVTVPAGAGFPSGVVYSYNWESPWFDLRPDLRSSQAQSKIGVPIWSSAARLYVELVGPVNGSSLVSPKLAASSFDVYETTNLDPGQIPSFGPGQSGAQGVTSPSVDLSSVFFPAWGGTPQLSSLGVFSPPGTTAGGGDGYPVRYWKLVAAFTARFEVFPGTPPDPPLLTIQATYY